MVATPGGIIAESVKYGKQEGGKAEKGKGGGGGGGEMERTSEGLSVCVCVL